jgi:hypothetical protein
MRYRIKIITYKNGRKVYMAQKKAFIGWDGLHSDGESDSLCTLKLNSREAALRAIDLNFAGNFSEQKIEFEYITK